MKAWIAVVVLALCMGLVILALCAGPGWALAGQQWQCGTDTDVCRYGHPLTFLWDDGGAGGTFSDAALRNPVYTPAENLTGADVVVTLTVTGTCTDDTAIHGAGGVPVTVFTESHSITIEATAVPLVVAMGESSQLRAEAQDALGPVSWQWSDGGLGAFEPSPRVADPLYWPSLPGRVPVRVSGSVESPYPQSAEAGLVLLSLAADGSIFSDVTPDFWAYDEILDLYRRGVVNGYSDGTYQPALLVDRATMAVYLARTFEALDPVG